MGRASSIEAALSKAPFQPVSLPPPANAPYSRWAGCHFFHTLPHKGQGCGPRARKQVSTTTEPSPFRSAGQRRLQTECSKPPGTNAPGISAPASSPPLSGTGWLQLGRASPIEATLSNAPFQPFPCHPLQIRHTAAGRDATSSASCPAKVRVAAHGPESRFPPQQSLPFSGLRASVGFKPNAPSFTARTRRASPTPQTATRGNALPRPADTLRSSSTLFIYQKRTGPIRYCPAEKSNASNHAGFPMPRTSAPHFFLDLRGRSMPHMAISYIYE